MAANPYEYYHDTLGIQSRFLFDGKFAHEESLCLIGARGLQLMVDRKSIYRLRNCGPGSPALLKWDSLPDSWKNLCVQSFGEPQKRVRKSLFEEYYIRDYKAVDFYTCFRFEDGSLLHPDKIEEYVLNASVLNTAARLYEKRRSLRIDLKIETKSTWYSIVGDCVDFKRERAHTLPEHPDRLRRLFKQYKKSGYSVLISKRHGNDNARVVTFEVELLLNELFAEFRHKPSMADVAAMYEGFLSGEIDVINNATGELYNPNEFPQLSAGTITSYLAKWENKIATHAIRSGDRQKYMAAFQVYHSLSQPKYAGSLISVDDRQPVFEYEKGRRMWFYNAIDTGSEAFTCWVYGKSKEGIILEFYRQMVRNYAEWGFNLPAELEGELSLNSSFKDTFLQEGNMFQYVRIEANKARAKRIEQYYRPLRYEYEKRREGWLARPFALNESNQAGPANTPLIPYEQIVQGCLQDIENWNNSEHSKIKGKSRWDVFCEMQNPNLRPTNYRAIIPYLGYKTDTSCNVGIMKLQGKEFLLGNNGLIATGDQLINLMIQAEGRKVQIYWLDGNDGNILKAYVYIGDQYICEAIQKPVYNRARIERTSEDEANRELMCKYEATITAFGKKQRSFIDSLTVIDNRPRTFNSGFKIRGLNGYELEYAEVETMPELDTEFDAPYLMGIETGFKPSLIDRF